MLRLDFARSAVTEYWLEPFPGARPIVPLLLILRPYDAFCRALGSAQLHGTLIAFADASGRKDIFRGWHEPAPDVVPCLIESDRTRRIGYRQISAESDEPESMRAHDLCWPPSPAPTYKNQVPDFVRAHIRGGQFAH